MQKGGVSIIEGYDNNTALYFFLENSTCNILTYKSRGGIIFKLTLNEYITSPYIVNRSVSINTPLNEILIKIVFIDDTKPDKEKNIFQLFNFQLFNKEGFQITELNNTTSSEFLSEIKIQSDIYGKSFDYYFEPICPGILFSSIYDIHNNNLSYLLNLLKEKKNDDTTEYILLYILSYIENIKDIKENIYRYNIKIGIIIMEYMSGYITLHDYINNPNTSENKKQNAKYMAMYEIARLFNLGYIHGDLNMGNLVINPTYTYFDKIPGRVILIDFGSAFEHNIPKLESYENLYSNAVTFSYNLTSPKYDEGTAKTFSDYQWLQFKDSNVIGYADVNDEVVKAADAKLFELYNRRKRIKEFFDLHIKNSNIRKNENLGGNNNPFFKLDPKRQLTKNFIKKIIKEEKHNSIIKRNKIIKNIKKIIKEEKHNSVIKINKSFKNIKKPKMNKTIKHKNKNKK